MKRNLRLPRGLFATTSHLCFADGDELSLRDELAAALTADAASQDAGTLEATPAPAPAAAPATPAPEGETPAQAADRARDEAGRFAKQATPVTPPPDPKTPSGAAEPAATQTITPPPSWSATAKADWGKLPPHIQQEVLKREGDIQNGKAQWDQKAERFNALDQVLAPRSERFRLAGVSEAQAVQQLFAAADLLERNGRDGIIYLARQYGVDLRQFAQGGQAPAQQQAHPALQQLYGEINTLKGALAQQQQTASQADQTRLAQTIDQFRADPKNVYFENVRTAMGHLIRGNPGLTLQEAYDQATWANPEIRPLLLRSQQDASAAEVQAAARAKAIAARQASGSVVGSPTPGSSAANGGAANTLREELVRAFADAT